jgi:hypothetical protein
LIRRRIRGARYEAFAVARAPNAIISVGRYSAATGWGGGPFVIVVLDLRTEDVIEKFSTLDAGRQRGLWRAKVSLWRATSQALLTLAAGNPTLSWSGISAQLPRHHRWRWVRQGLG